jgi:ppGpp synthetase/RelA/SpoT-type nucleotidyltranferase
MKVSASTRELYRKINVLAIQLKEEIEKELIPYCNKHKYLFKSRIKTEDSFSEKLEAGRNIEEDFYAATIIVDTYNQIKLVKKYLKSTFQLLEERPKKASRPEEFMFNGSRNYLRLASSLHEYKLPIKDIIFEVQIQTLLEYSWSHIFHDISYKTDDINWSKERLSHQVQALLKNADLLVHETNSLSKSKFLTDNSDYSEYKKLKQIKSILELCWRKNDFTSSNIKRQCISIHNLLDFIGYSIDKLKELIVTATNNGRGGKLLNLSPFNAIIQTILDTDKVVFQRDPSKYKNGKYYIFLIDEIELPSDFGIANYPVFKKISEVYRKYTDTVLDV